VSGEAQASLFVLLHMFLDNLIFGIDLFILNQPGDSYSHSITAVVTLIFQFAHIFFQSIRYRLFVGFAGTCNLFFDFLWGDFLKHLFPRCPSIQVGHPNDPALHFCFRCEPKEATLPNEDSVWLFLEIGAEFMGDLGKHLAVWLFGIVVIHVAHANYCRFTLFGAVMNLREAGTAHRLIGAD